MNKFGPRQWLIDLFVTLIKWANTDILSLSLHENITTVKSVITQDRTRCLGAQVFSSGLGRPGPGRAFSQGQKLMRCPELERARAIS